MTSKYLFGDWRRGNADSGLEAVAIKGEFVKRVTATGGTLTVVQQNASNAERTVTFTPSGGGPAGDTAITLQNRSSLPSTTGFSDGDLINFNGLQVLVPSGERANEVTGTATAQTGDYVGTDDIHWSTADTGADPVIFFVDKTVAGGSPPSALFLRFHTGNFYSDFELTRDNGRDTSARYAYANGSDRVESGFGVGSQFTVFAFGSDGTTPVTLHGAVDRWELYNKPTSPLPDLISGGKGDIAFSADGKALQGDIKAGVIEPTDLDANTDAKKAAFRSALDVVGVNNSVPHIGAASELPDPLGAGYEFEASANFLFHRDATLTVGTATEGWGKFGSIGSVSPALNDVAEGPFGYNSDPGNAANIRNRVFVWRRNGGRTPQTLEYDGSTYALTQLHPGSSTDHRWVAAGITANDLQSDTGNEVPINVQFTDGTWALEDQPVERGHYYEYDESAHELFLSARNPAEPAAVPVHAVDVFEGTGAGLNVTNSSTDTPSVVRVFEHPPFDLDDTGNGHGHFFVEATLHMATSGSPTSGFNEDTTTPLRTVLIEGQVSASALLASTAYDSGSTARQGLELANQTVRNGSAVLGTIHVQIFRDSDNQIGVYLWYDGSSGAINFTVGSTLDVIFIPSDSAGGAAPTVDRILDWDTKSSPMDVADGIWAEVPVAAAFTRELTADDDAKLMLVEYAYNRSSTAFAQELAFIDTTIPVDVWRGLPNNAAGAHDFDAYEGWTARSEQSDSPNPNSSGIKFSKGPNGRIMFVKTGGDGCNILHVRVTVR